VIQHLRHSIDQADDSSPSRPAKGGDESPQGRRQERCNQYSVGAVTDVDRRGWLLKVLGGTATGVFLARFVTHGLAGLELVLVALVMLIAAYPVRQEA
jgi:hypothetical protein